MWNAVRALVVLVVVVQVVLVRARVVRAVVRQEVVPLPAVPRRLWQQGLWQHQWLRWWQLRRRLCLLGWLPPKSICLLQWLWSLQCRRWLCQRAHASISWLATYAAEWALASEVRSVLKLLTRPSLVKHWAKEAFWERGAGAQVKQTILWIKTVCSCSARGLKSAQRLFVWKYSESR